MYVYISLQPTVYKIYAAILAKRLATWAIFYKRISPSQKGFLPYEGCAKHSFLLRSVFEDSKRRNRNVRVYRNMRVVWLDLRNASTSCNHVGNDAGFFLDVPDHFIPPLPGHYLI